MCKLHLKVWTTVPRSRTVSVSYLVEAGAAGRHAGILLRSDRQVRKKRQQGRSCFLELGEGGDRQRRHSHMHHTEQALAW